MRLALIVFKLSKDPDFERTDWQTDWQTDGRTEGKPIVPSGVNTGRGLIMNEEYVKLNFKETINGFYLTQRLKK